MSMRWMLMLAVVGASLAGCLDDDSDPDGTGAAPDDGADAEPGGNLSLLPETITGMEFVTTADANSTTGIWLHEGRAYLSGSAGLRIFDIQDPTYPVLLRADIADTASRDVDIMEHPNGRLYAVLSAGTVKLVDVTEPATAAVVSEGGSFCSHNIATVPNSTIVYNSKSICSTQGQAQGEHVEIIDFADPTAPKHKVLTFPPAVMTVGGAVRPVTGVSCHDITFHAPSDLAYCAAVTQTHAWDISDPWNPEIIQIIDWPATNIHHGVWATSDGDMLILGDEVAGVVAPVPGCGNEMPTSALWFIDVSDIETPTPVGYHQVSHDAAAASAEEGELIYCSTHFGTLVEDRPYMVMGWYTAGTSLIDFSDPTDVQEVALYTAPGTNTWEARYYEGHVYTGDTGRGMEILRII